MPEGLRSFWSMPTADVLSALQSSPTGLAAETAAERLARIGPNVLGECKRSDTPALLLRQFTSPLVLLLIAAAVLSFALHDSTLRSRPGRALLSSTLAVAAATLAIPYTPLGAAFGFVPLPPLFLGLMGLIVLGYVVSAELAKRWFYRGVHR